MGNKLRTNALQMSLHCRILPSFTIFFLLLEWFDLLIRNLPPGALDV